MLWKKMAVANRRAELLQRRDFFEGALRLKTAENL